MTVTLDAPTSLTDAKKISAKKLSIAIIGMMTGVIFTTATANAAPEITISQPITGSTTIVEQSSDGEVATITATPNGISMQNGVPFSVTQIATVPRYAIHQGSIDQVAANQNTTTVTALPVPITNQVTQVNVVTTPMNTVTQVMPVVSNNVPALTNQAIATTSLDTLQLKPTFSTPDVVTSQTKIMKILKNAAGNEFAVPANHVAPGDIIEYHTTYTNTTARPVNNVNAIVTLPNGVKLVSLNSSLPTLATTGGDRYQTINMVGNSAVIQESYSGLKWNLVDLGSNAAQTVIMRATVQ